MTRLHYNALKTGAAGAGVPLSLGASLTSSATSVTFNAALTYNNGTAVPTISGSDYIPLAILDASGQLSEVVWLTAYTSGATTGTITRGKEGTTGVAHSSGDKVVHGPTVTDIATGVLAYTAYAAASNYTKGSGATHAMVDSTNLVVSFIAPPTGNVLVELSALLGGPTAIGQWIEYSLFESGTILAGTTRQVIQGTNPLLQQLSRHAITGLTPGSVHTYAWGWRAANCTATMYNDPALMTVTALP